MAAKELRGSCGKNGMRFRIILRGLFRTLEKRKGKSQIEISDSKFIKNAIDW